MDTAQITVSVAVLAGAAAVVSYLVQTRQAGDLDWSRDLPRVAAIAFGLGAFVMLLFAPDPLPRLTIAAGALIGGSTFWDTHPSPQAGR